VWGNTLTNAKAQDTLDCEDFDSQADAQANLRDNPSDPNRLDEDNGEDDGVACENHHYDNPARDETPVNLSGGSTNPNPGVTKASSPPPKSAPPSPPPPPTPVPQPSQPPPLTDPAPPLMKAGGTSSGPVPIMPNGSCPQEFPNVRDKACYSS
jgi:hypothetical protein